MTTATNIIIHNVLYPDWDKLVGGGLLRRKVTQLQEQIQERCKTEKCKVRMLSFGDDEITIYFKTERGKKKHRLEDFLDIKGIREKQASDNLYSDEHETDQVDRQRIEGAKDGAEEETHSDGSGYGRLGYEPQ